MTDVTEAISRNEAEPPFFLGIDVGGTGIKIGLVDDRGRVLGRTQVPTHQERGPQDACLRIKEVSLGLAAECKVDLDSIGCVGLATPGTMNIAEGMLLRIRE